MCIRDSTQLEHLPLTAHGKLDRNALPAPRFGAQIAIEQDQGGPSAAAEHAYVPARNATERLVCEQLAELTGQTRIGRNDHFFRLGGHSLLAARLVTRLRQQTGRSLPLRTLFTTPVVKDIAKTLDNIQDSNAQAPFNTLLPIRPKGTRPPLFCMYPVIGLAWPYFSLLKFTNEDQPIWGVQSPSAIAGYPSPQTLGALIRSCVTTIESVSTHDCIRLLGWSFGGVLAHRVATYLQAKGKTIDSLIMLDAYPPWCPPDGFLPPDPRIDGIWRDLAFGLDIEVPESMANRALDAAQLKSLAHHQRHPTADWTASEFTHFAEIMDLNTRLAIGADFELFSGDIQFVSAKLRPANFDKTRMTPDAWAPYCSGRIQVEKVYSTHNNMLSEYALAQMHLFHNADLKLSPSL